jgi:heme-degrading monooxygenase HmoA
MATELSRGRDYAPVSESEIPMNQSPVLLHVWRVHPEEEATLVERLGKMIGQVNDDPGFVSARLLASADRTSVAALIEMRSVEDRQRLEELPEVRETLHTVEGAYNVVIRLFQEVGAYSGAGKPVAQP